MVDQARLRGFLESQFVPAVGLLRAATFVFPDARKIYTTSDNLHAVNALEILESSLADSVRNTLYGKYARYCRNGFHEIVLGEKIPWPPRTAREIRIERVGDYAVVHEAHNGAVFQDYLRYGDLTAYYGLEGILEGDVSKVRTAFSGLNALWDGTGFGSIKGVYATYKCALVYYLMRRADENKISYKTKFTKDELEKRMTLQQRKDGGILTDYDTRRGSLGDANTETTSLVAIALWGT